jgi:hypothetical protein
METAEVLSLYIGDGSTPENAYRPAVRDDYDLYGYSDVTALPTGNKPSEPNTFAVVVEAETAVINAIAADPKYHIEWRGEIGVPATQTIDDVMTPAEFAEFETYLKKNGYIASWIAANTDMALTKGDNANMISAAMGVLPHEYP